jgi:hypothetical protein
MRTYSCHVSDKLQPILEHRVAMRSIHVNAGKSDGIQEKVSAHEYHDDDTGDTTVLLINVRREKRAKHDLP